MRLGAAFTLGMVCALGLGSLLAAQTTAPAQVSGRAVVRHSKSGDRHADNADVVVWLTAEGPEGVTAVAAKAEAAPHFRMAQRNKKFEPHLLVIPVGAVVAFPNYDPFFHNVFSLGDGGPFDLLLYQAGGSRSKQFTRAGVSFIFCNIHPQMSAVIITVPSRWYATSNAQGDFAFSDVPPGRYQLHVWYEHAQGEKLTGLQREIEVNGDMKLDPIVVEETAPAAGHKNKYGQDYDTEKSY